MPRRRLPLAHALVAAAGLLAAGCGNPREDARTELTRLGDAMTAHASRYGRYPETVDAARPADARNLPFTAERGVELRLLQSGRGGYQAVATRRKWVCWMMAGAGGGERMECAPVGSATRAASIAAGLPIEPPPTVLHSPALTRADSDSAVAVR
ncbi:MAG TPA: hypothetical protein VFS20_17820 [Longimicrobium sp.]|nr:hypothetical protein [Longimicrobium sp.]